MWPIIYMVGKICYRKDKKTPHITVGKKLEAIDFHVNPYYWVMHIQYSSKFLWSNIFVIFMDYTEIRNFLPQKFPYGILKYRAWYFEVMK